MKLYTLDNQFIEETNEQPTNFTGIIEWSNGTKQWLVNGKLHRLDGPAIEHYSGSKYWYIDNIKCAKEQHKLLHSIMKLKGLI